MIFYEIHNYFDHLSSTISHIPIVLIAAVMISMKNSNVNKIPAISVAALNDRALIQIIHILIEHNMRQKQNLANLF